MASTLAAVHEIRRAQRADGPAAMLGIGTANPAYYVLQDEFPDYYFRITKKEHLTDLKDTFSKLCCSSARRVGRCQCHARWGRPATDITHLIVSTSSEARSPGADLGLAMLLGLRPDVCRTVLQLNGCSAGCAALRLAKDLAENNRGARVLVACVELTITSFRGLHEGDNFDTLIPQALFGDGAGAVVGADAMPPVERPLFEMVYASQALIPGSEQLLNMRLGEGGIDGDISFNLPRFTAQNLEHCLLDAFRPLAVNGVEWKWNDLFWAVHPGSRGILDHIDSALGLEPRKLAASRTVLRDYGNMLSATVIFVLEELHRRMDEEGRDEAEWGMMVAFGPGFTVETMVLHATKC
ncbi:bisdemethoxycurcumin synthase-like [Panicum miliaceum]|uniref:Bisdemethoxycurcumin synthase-like n=1 Tax=Panicum miliaceum TaxID=4540 RepID=A0A3L6T5X0_PANMI|nr:bisdemethoxycurcumin synthase-like [Panicum miliaceum]